MALYVFVHAWLPDADLFSTMSFPKDPSGKLFHLKWHASSAECKWACEGGGGGGFAFDGAAWMGPFLIALLSDDWGCFLSL